MIVPFVMAAEGIEMKSWNTVPTASLFQFELRARQKYLTYFYIFLCIAMTQLLSDVRSQAATVRADYYFSKDIFTKDIGDLYFHDSQTRTVVGKDVVILGGDVNIDEPIFTNGGNVIILADHLRVSAPIDTRIYIKHPILYGAQLTAGPENRFFAGYYFTQYIWDNTNKWWRLGLRDQADQAVKSRAPRLPQGRMGSNPLGGPHRDMGRDRRANTRDFVERCRIWRHHNCSEQTRNLSLRALRHGFCSFYRHAKK